MLEVLLEFFVLTFSIILIENALFARALGTSKMLTMIRHPRKVVLFGIALTVITMLSSVFTWMFNFVINQYGNKSYIRSAIFIVCLSVVYVCAYLFMKKFMPNYTEIRELLPSATFNCAALGALLLSSIQNHNLYNTLLFGLGTGLGYTLAAIFLHYIRRCIMLSRVPKSFKGTAILLVFIGIFSLAIYGLIGHQLPS